MPAEESEQGGVPALPVVENLQVLEQGGGQLQSGAPPSAVEQFDLAPGPEGLHHRLVHSVPDGAHRGKQAGGVAWATVVESEAANDQSTALWPGRHMEGDGAVTLHIVC
ncbi:hypothetical protein GCM10022206_22410 [Streptomyces chiangmaiensis]